VSTKRLDGDGVSQTELRTRDGQATTVSDDAITALAEVLRGRLVQPSDADYDHARAVWNGMVDRHPALIVQSAGVADVVTSVSSPRSTICSLPSEVGATMPLEMRCATTGS